MSSQLNCPKLSEDLHDGTNTEMHSVYIKDEPILGDELGCMDTPDLVRIKQEPEDGKVGETNMRVADVFDIDKWNNDIKEEHEMEIGVTEVKLENDNTKCNGSGSSSVDETSLNTQTTKKGWKEKFLTEILKSENEKSSHFKVLTKERYLELLAQVEEAEKTEKKTALQQRRVKRFGVLNFGGVKRLFARHEENIRYHLPADELYDVIDAAHLAVGHAGRDKMLAETSKVYANITKEMISLYLSMCEVCQQKKTKKRGLDSKPIHHTEVNNRCQVNLIDFQTRPDGKFKFIMVYQDYPTKFVLLRALESNAASEVALQLNDIFLTIGAPCILQSDSGKEFVNLVINDLTSLWPELRIVHGKTRESVGSIEHINRDIDRMISSWLKDNKSTKWSEGLRYVQFAKNRTFHPGIKQSPYKAMFGTEPKVGLTTTLLPPEIIKDIQDEDDLRKLIVDNDEIDLSKDYDKLEDDKMSDSGDYGIRKDIQKAAEHMEHQAKKIKTVSDKLHPSAKVGDIPDFDKDQADLLQKIYSRTELDFGTQTFEEQEVDMLAAAATQSDGVGQGIQMCSCTTNCSTNRCRCKKKMILCNVKCHQTTSCKNK